MSTRPDPDRDERGMALVASVLAVLLASTLVAALIGATSARATPPAHASPAEILVGWAWRLVAVAAAAAVFAAAREGADHRLPAPRASRAPVGAPEAGATRKAS